MATGATDFFEPEPHIVNKLKTIPEISGRVIMAPELQSFLDSNFRPQNSPALGVVYIDSPAEQNGPGYTTFRLEWSVVVCVKHLNDEAGIKARKVAGPLCSTVTKKLLGYKPCPNFLAFEVTRVAPPARTQEWFMWPVIIRTQTTITGENDGN